MPNANGSVLTLDLTRHCIETAIRKRYERGIRAYFRTKTGQAPIEAEIELLVRALETLDFPYLRTHYPILAGANRHQVQLLADHAGQLELRIDGKPLADLPSK